MVNFSEINGIGNKTIQTIEANIPKTELNQFHSELENLEFNKLFSLGLDTKTEQEIIKHAVCKYYDFEYATDLMQSPQVRKTFQELLSLIRKQFVLENNKKEIIFLSPTTNKHEIARRQELVARAISFTSQYSKEQIKEMRKLLSSAPIKKINSEEIVVLCDEEKLFLELKKLLPKETILVCLNNREEFEQYASYDLLRFVYTDESKLICEVEEADNVIAIKWRKQILEVAPEMLKKEFLEKKQRLESVESLITDHGVAADQIEKEVLQSILSSLERETQTVEAISREDLEKLRTKAESLVEEELSATQISGVELLKLLKSPVCEHLLLRKVVENVKEKLAEEHKDRLPLLSFETIIPEIDTEAILEFEQEKMQNYAEASFQKHKDFYQRFYSQKGILDSARKFLERIDFLLGIGEFFATANAPRINSNKRFSCMNLTSTVLSSKESNIQAITYYLDRSQTILTGANSGGKTSLLYLLLETQLLAQMGLYVKGAAQIRLYDKIHFFSKSSGTVGSGAFETTLKDLAKIANGKDLDPEEDRTLVLLDEIESITEPGAAGRLISATLEWFEKNEEVDLVLVSHLGEILEELCPNARIDGIEAVSLDDALELVVDRNPKIGVLAKSTPQLIVQKLAMQDTENAYFQFLQEKMGLETTKDEIIIEHNVQSKAALKAKMES